MDADFLLSKNFSFYEMTATARAEFQEVNRAKAFSHTLELTGLCQIVLEPVRAHFGKPLIIHSAFRCADLNKSVGGSPTSQHTLGQAADFHIPGVNFADIFNFIWRESNIPFGQLIDEKNWIHCSTGAPWRDAARCGEVLSLNSKTGKLELVSLKRSI